MEQHCWACSQQREPIPGHTSNMWQRLQRPDIVNRFDAGSQRDVRTKQKVDLVDICGAGCSRSRARQVIACNISKLLRGLDTRDVSHGPKKTLAFPLERKQWETPAASCRCALFHSDSRATVQALGQGSTQDGPASVVVATQVTVGGTCSIEIIGGSHRGFREHMCQAFKFRSAHL